MSLLAMRAERGALTTAPAFSGYCVLGKAIVIVAITESACVETAINTRPAEVLGVAVCEHFYDRHGPEWKPLFCTTMKYVTRGAWALELALDTM